MKYFFTAIYLLACNLISGQGIWTPKANFGGTSRYAAVGFSIGNKGYVGTGMDGTVKKDFWEWDKNTNVWTQKADFGGAARYSAAGFSIGTKGYIGTGMDGTSTRRKDFWEYDPSTNVWTQKADFAGTAREGAVGFSIGSLGYIGTGQESVSVFKKDFWEYNPSANTWTARTNFGGTVRSAAVGFSIGTKGYIGTGVDAAGAAKNDFWEWDQGTNSWTQKANFGGVARFGAAGFSIGTKAYIGVGRDGALAYKKDFWEWDQASNTWMQAVNFSGTARNAVTSFVIGNRAYMGTGFDGTYKKDFWEWNTVPASTVTSTNPLCFGQCNGTATATVSGGTTPYTFIWSNGQSTSAATGLCNATYTFTLVDADQDSNVVAVSLTEPALLTSSISSSANVSCFGGNDGAAAVSAAGGTLAYTYAWSNGASTSSLTGLSAGTYIVTVTDLNGCTAASTVTITEPTLLTSSIASQTNVLCNGMSTGDATASASGGTLSYGYLWNNGQSNATATGLSAGSYTVTVTDAKGCTSSSTVSITEPTVITYTVTENTATCLNANGDAAVNVSGGVPGYTYSWTSGHTTSAVTGLYAGSYSFTVADANGCTVSYFANVTNIGGDSVFIASTASVSCNGGMDGAATCTVIGTTSPHTYLWSSSPAQTTITATGLGAGIYNVTMTDSAGCIDIATAVITEPAAISYTFAIANVSCNGLSDGAATVTAAGGVGGYSYTWSPSGGSASSVTGLSAGNYTVTITDANGCTAVDSVSITEPALLAVSVTGLNADCNNASTGSASAVASGGTLPYSYSWSPSGGSASSATGLPAGNYSVTVTDANSCSATATVSITEPAAIVVSTNTVSPVCSGACTTLAASSSGGSGAHSYSWQPGNLSGAIVTVCPTSNTNYIVTATDSLNCTQTDTVIVQIKNVPVILSLSPDTVCETDSPFALTGGNPAGGTYSGPGVSAGNFDPGAAGAGLHTIVYTFTDTNGCTDSASAQLFVDLCTGISGVFSSVSSVWIYPNPGSGVFFIHSENYSDQLLTLELFNVMGEKTVDRFIDKNSINLSGISAGIYFYRFSEANNPQRIIGEGKIVIQD